MTESVEDYAARQAAEYGTYVANGQITYNGAIAYNEGDAVPASNVALHNYLELGLVRRVDDPPPVLPEAVEPQVGEPIVLEPTTEEED
jgi:hypothetical protein